MTFWIYAELALIQIFLGEITPSYNNFVGEFLRICLMYLYIYCIHFATTTPIISLQQQQQQQQQQ